jgi:hypothetical protein
VKLQRTHSFSRSCRLLLFSSVLLATICARGEAAASPDSRLIDALPDAPQAQTRKPDSVTLGALPLNILKDQGILWTSPFHIKVGDLKVVLPLLAATCVAISTDHHVMKDVVSHDPGFNNANINVSNAMIGGMLISPGFLYGVGHFDNNEHARETGLLGAEAIADGVVIEQGMKLIFWRERPNQGDGHGHFFETSAGIDSSFPSSHSELAWATAAVIAGEYHNPWTQFLVYTGATTISLTRVLGQQHFPADVLVGSATGWLVGHYVYKHRHRWEAPRHFHIPR